MGQRERATSSATSRVSIPSAPSSVRCRSIRPGGSSSADTRGRVLCPIHMATFDQLPADQRAIIELVLKRGRSYEQLADMLQMPETRVRELARIALTDLSPITAKRVDSEWRDQVADYALGQQSGPESAATKGHLRRSEPARVWLGSVVDSLEQFYNDENLPDLPEPDGDRARASRGPREAAPVAAAAATKEKDKAKADDDGDKREPLSSSVREAVQRRR